MQTILLLQKSLKRKWIVHWEEKWKRLVKKTQIHLEVHVKFFATKDPFHKYHMQYNFLMI